MSKTDYKKVLEAAGYVLIQGDEKNPGDKYGFQMYGMRFVSADEMAQVKYPDKAVIEQLQSLKVDMNNALDAQIKKIKDLK